MASAGRSARIRIAVAAALSAALFAVAQPPGRPPVDAGPPADACLRCHGVAEAAGATLTRAARPPPIDRHEFARSHHAGQGCAACHPEFDVDAHGRKAQPGPPSRRDRSLAANAICRECHEAIADAYRDSVHAALAFDGDPNAPLCSACHPPHAAASADTGVKAAAGAACAGCHEHIAVAQAASVHGRELGCTACHRSHGIRAASVGEHVASACQSCHAGVAATHARWLPRIERHLGAVSCAACHAPRAQRRVNLQLHADGAPLRGSDRFGVPHFRRRAAAANHGGLDSHELSSLLQDLQDPLTGRQATLRGRLEPRNGEHAHALAPKAAALRDCGACHRDDADAFDSVVVSIVGHDGRPLRQPAREGVLHSVRSLESVRGFYALGATRIKWLDVLLVAAFAAGIGLPAVHWAMIRRRSARGRGRR